VLPGDHRGRPPPQAAIHGGPGELARQHMIVVKSSR
jgi:hypothetical protein